MLHLRLSISSICVPSKICQYFPLLRLSHIKCGTQSACHVTTDIQKRQLYTTLGALNTSSTKSNLYRDIYKDIGYQSPFTQDENSLILKTLNRSSEEELCEVTAKPRAVNIFEHKQQHGEFNVVEELLSVKKFDEKILERLGKKIIKVSKTNEDDSDETSKFSSSEEKKLEKLKTKLAKYLKPRLKSSDYASRSISSIIAIKMSYYSLSYSHMDKNTKTILDWKNLPCFALKDSDSTAGFRSNEHPKIFETAMSLTSQIPTADLYIFEEPLPILHNQNHSYANFMSKGNLKSYVATRKNPINPLLPYITV